MVKKRDYLKAAIIIAVLAVSILITPKAFAVNCTDSDGGFEIYKKGAVVDVGHPGTFSASDTCIDTNTLLEYTCKNDAWYANSYQACANGCIDGACLAVPISSRCADLNGDGVVSILDASMVGLSWGCEGVSSSYNSKADINGDKCVDQKDSDIITANWNQTTTCAQAKICPDINADGIVNILDASFVGLSWGLCEGQAGYNSKADLNSDKCVSNGDSLAVAKYWNVSAVNIPVCAVLKKSPCGSYGDIDNDGYVTQLDKTLLSQLSTGEITVEDGLKGRSDLNGNGQLADAGDLVLITRFLLGEINTFTVCSAKSIQVVSPNGGEQWEIGKAYNITWTSIGYDKVRVNVTCEGYGTGAIMDVSSGASGGSYNFTVPANWPAQSKCKAQVSENLSMLINNVSGVNYDMSDGYFSVTPSSVNSAIKVVSPNGGEQWLFGSTVKIMWKRNWMPSQANGLVTILIKKGSGTSTLIAQNIPDASGYELTILPSMFIHGYDYKVVVTSNGYGTNLSDESDNYFSIIEPTTPSIKVIYPNGGEQWEAGKTYTIKWYATIYDKVRINVDCENYSSGGIMNIPSGANIGGGSYNFTVPANWPAQSKCKAQVSENLSMLINNVSGVNYDMSDGYFSVIAPLKKSPCGSYGDLNNDGYITNNDADLVLSSIVGNALLTDVQKLQGDVNNSGSLDTGDATLIKRYVSGLDTTFAVCSASKSIQVISPNGGETIIAGQDVEIFFINSSTRKTDVLITNCADEGSLCNGNNYGAAIVDGNADNTIQKAVTNISLNAAPGRYKAVVEAVDFSSPSFRVAKDKSDSFFNVVSSDIGSIIVSSPLNNSTFAQGDSIKIKWTTSGAIGTNAPVKIWLIKGYDTPILIKDSNIETSVSNEYVWAIPNTISIDPYNNYRIKVVSSSNIYISGNSGYFKISSSFIPTPTPTPIPTPTPDACILPDGTLVKLPGDPKIYVIRDCKKVWIRTADEFINSGYKWSDVSEVPANTVNSIPDISSVGSAANIPEGAIIQASGDQDVYIVKYAGSKKFKRLILSPSVFKSYGHLKWENIIKVDKATLDSFQTSNLVKSENGRIYKLIPSGDTGLRNHVKDMVAFQRLAFDLDAVYQINAVDESSYLQGQELE